MLLNQLRRLFQTFGPKTEVAGELNGRRNPELRLSFRVLHVDMGASFLAREEEEPEPSDPKHRWAHLNRINPIRSVHGGGGVACVATSPRYPRTRPRV